VLEIGCDQGCAVIRIGREYAQRLAERDRGLVGHPGELAAADHTHDGEACAGIHAAERNRPARRPE